MSAICRVVSPASASRAICGRWDTFRCRWGQMGIGLSHDGVLWGCGVGLGLRSWVCGLGKARQSWPKRRPKSKEPRSKTKKVVCLYLYIRGTALREAVRLRPASRRNAVPGSGRARRAAAVRPSGWCLVFIHRIPCLYIYIRGSRRGEAVGRGAGRTIESQAGCS